MHIAQHVVNLKKEPEGDAVSTGLNAARLIPHRMDLQSPDLRSSLQVSQDGEVHCLLISSGKVQWLRGLYSALRPLLALTYLSKRPRSWVLSSHSSVDGAAETRRGK